MSGWQPIITAPRDGRVVKLKVNGRWRLGRYGTHGTVPGWLSAQGSPGEIMWPQPSEWADVRMVDDTPLYRGRRGNKAPADDL